MLKILLIVVAAILLIAGCSNEDEQVPPPSETYFGRYYSGIVGQSTPRIDSMELSIVNGSYTLFIVNPLNDVGGDICSSIGEITGFPGIRVMFKPDTVMAGGCDSLRIPNGTFLARYVGDSAFMSIIDTISYEIYRPIVGDWVHRTDIIELRFELTR